MATVCPSTRNCADVPLVTMPSTSTSDSAVPSFASSSWTAVTVIAPATGGAEARTSTYEPFTTPAGMVAPAAMVTA